MLVITKCYDNYLDDLFCTLYRLKSGNHPKFFAALNFIEGYINVMSDRELEESHYAVAQGIEVHTQFNLFHFTCFTFYI